MSERKTEWKRDEGYCGCKTARFGETAVVICPPEYSDNRWGFQAFDESSDWAIQRGETICQHYGFDSEQEVMQYVEQFF